MKTHCQPSTARLASIGAALLLAQTAAMGESQYGYSPSGGTDVTASAKVEVKVTVPTLILLRVGTAGTTQDLLEFEPAPGVNSAPTATALGGLTADVSDQAADWGGTAPTFTAPTGQPLTAYVWTNSNGGGELGFASTITTAMSGTGALAPSHITVAVSAATAGMPAHPATTSTNPNFGSFARNAVHSATWTYSVDATALEAAPAGVYEQETVYTATSL